MKALVTGGGGFLGGAIVRRLRARGDEVRSFARGNYPQLEALGVQVIRGEVADAGAVFAAAQGCDIVFHVAGKVGIWGRYEDYERVNVQGTRNVLEACRHWRIRRLVHTSSPSVVFAGHDMEGVDESVPYPEHFEAHYPHTKALAEQMVLEANGPVLATVALRPHLIWGPGDNNLVPRVIARAKAGKLVRVGHRPNKVDNIYIDNAADAHLLAADRLAPESPIAGKVYFISQDEPLPLWDFVNRILAAADLPSVTRTIPHWAALTAGFCLEQIYRLARIQEEPRLTRFLVHELTTSHWFDISAAKRDFGYHPTVSTDEGMRRLAESLKATGQ